MRSGKLERAKCPIFSSSLGVNGKFLKIGNLLISVNDDLLQPAKYFYKIFQTLLCSIYFPQYNFKAQNVYIIGIIIKDEFSRSR